MSVRTELEAELEQLQDAYDNETNPEMVDEIIGHINDVRQQIDDTITEEELDNVLSAIGSIQQQFRLDYPLTQTL